MKFKPYKGRTLSAAISTVHQYQKLAAKLDEALGRAWQERDVLAKLAAAGPCFSNPLEVSAARSVRDRILRERFDLAPDGTPLPKGTS